MTTYKAILQILIKNKGSLLLGIIVMAIITFFYAGELQSNPTDLSGAKIAVLSDDSSAAAQAFEAYLKTQHDVVTLEDDSQKGRDDALYFYQVDYILEIPKAFTQELNAGNKAEVLSQTRPGTFSKTLVDTTINNFINTYQTYQRTLPNASMAEILAYTKETLSKDGTVQFDQTYHQKQSQTAKGRMYNLLAYGLFMSIFSGYAVVNLAFNQPEIRRRNSCSPVSRRKLSRQISIGNFLYALFCLFVFSEFMTAITKGAFDQVTGYFMLNTLAFFAAMVSFSIMVTSLLTKSEAVSGINNVFIMGSCFIGGVFVPSEMLPDIVNKIAAFTPTYWFAQNNQLIGETVTFNQQFLDTFAFQSLVLLAFAGAFAVIHLMTMREKGGLRVFGKQAAAN